MQYYVSIRLERLISAIAREDTRFTKKNYKIIKINLKKMKT